jgi:hypothetical protein
MTAQHAQLVLELWDGHGKGVPAIRMFGDDTQGFCSPPPPTQIGGYGCCTGFGAQTAFVSVKWLPAKVDRSCVHSSLQTWIASSICLQKDRDQVAAEYNRRVF